MTLVFMCCYVMVMFVVYLLLLNVVCFLSLRVYLGIVSLCIGCNGCSDFCLICNVCCLRCSWSGSFSVLLCKCCVFVSCVHPKYGI